MKRLFAAYDVKFDARLKQAELDKRELGLDWDHVASPFFERPMIVWPEPAPAEKEYFAMKDMIDEKYMVPADGLMDGQELYDEVYGEAERIVAEQVAAKELGEEIDQADLFDQIQIKYAGSDKGQQIIKQYELITYVPNELRTPADHNDDRRSLNRKLDDRLFLILKKDRDSHQWHFPQMCHVDPPEDEENPPEDEEFHFKPGLRETAEKAMARSAGDKMQGYYYSHAPQGFYFYRYPEPRNGSIGAKVFFYRVRYLKGTPKPANGCVDYAWVTRDELKDYFDPDTFEFVRQMI